MNIVDMKDINKLNKRDIENEIISSKFIKEIGKLKGDLKKFATKSVIKAIKSKFS